MQRFVYEISKKTPQTIIGIIWKLQYIYTYIILKEIFSKSSFSMERWSMGTARGIFDRIELTNNNHKVYLSHQTNS